jgi:protease-4
LDVGTGGGYYLANEADSIIAHPTSIIGGVGVILNVYNLEDTMGQFNILATPVKSGDRIDAGTPIRPLEDAELDMLQQIAESFHERFIGRVVERRPQLDPLRKRWTSGDVMTGSEANDLGLVDAIGYLDDAINAARQQAGLKEDSAVILYRRNNDSAYTSLDVSPNQPLLPPLLPVRLPGLDRSTMPTFLYLWQPDPAMASQVGR